MSTIIEIIIPASEFDVGRVFADLPGITVELDRLVPTATAVVPYVWIRGASHSDIVDATRTHEAIRRVRAIDDVEEQGTLYRIEWSREVESSIIELSEHHLMLLSGHGTDTAWELTFRAEDRRDVSNFFELWAERGISVKFNKIYEVDTGTSAGGRVLSDAQHEALILAYRRGYFDEPRRATLEEISTTLDISRQALAGRLRRGTRTLVGHLVDEK